MSRQGNYPIGREVDGDKIYVQGPGRMRRSVASELWSLWCGCRVMD